jgi:hypothetical protein
MKAWIMAWVGLAVAGVACAGTRTMPGEEPSHDPIRPEALNRAGFDQKLNAQLPLDVEFRNEAGRDRQAGRLLRPETGPAEPGLFQLPDVVHPRDQRGGGVGPVTRVYAGAGI